MARDEQQEQDPSDRGMLLREMMMMMLMMVMTIMIMVMVVQTMISCKDGKTIQIRRREEEKNISISAKSEQ